MLCLCRLHHQLQILDSAVDDCRWVTSLYKHCGLYYRSMTIVNDNSRVVNKLEASLTDDARVIIYDRQMFIVQATGRNLLGRRRCLVDDAGESDRRTLDQVDLVLRPRRPWNGTLRPEYLGLRGDHVELEAEHMDPGGGGDLEEQIWV